jgi:hypothetical protein
MHKSPLLEQIVGMKLPYLLVDQLAYVTLCA